MTVGNPSNYIRLMKEFGSQLNDRNILRKLVLPFTLPLNLRKFFNEKMTLKKAQEEMEKGIASREERFLEIVQMQVYNRPGGSYNKLMKWAGCEFHDLRSLTLQNGLESALEKLAKEGVFLTAPEFKGKTDVIRGNVSFRVESSEFQPFDLKPAFVTQSSGTSNRPQVSISALDWFTYDTVTTGVFVLAHGFHSRRHAVYEPILPGVGEVVFMMMLAKLGIACDRWFARRVPIETMLEKVYCYTTAYELSLTGRLFGPGFASPEFLDHEDLHPIVNWVAENNRAGQLTCIRTVASNAARIARVALELGESLEGLTFYASGEPMTVAKQHVIERAGAKYTVLYGYEPGPIHVGFGCANPENVDEMHVNLNTLGVISHPIPMEHNGRTIHPLLFTTLYPSSAMFQLNVENGDFATLEERDCGCSMEKVGLKLHIHNVRSYEKFTSEGLNYPYWDLYELLETTLPADFGGGTGDYQLVEEEDGNGQSFLTLLVHLNVGTIDNERIVKRLQEAMSKGHRGNRFMTAVWDNAGTFRIKREPPIASGRGKIIPLRVKAQK
jgi:hypothetical protein